MRPACPPLIYSCRFLNFSQSRSEMDLAGRWAIQELEGKADLDLSEFVDPESENYKAMVDHIRKRLGLTTLRYQTIPDMLEAISLPKEKVCTYCWNGVG